MADVRTYVAESNGAGEIYISARPGGSSSVEEQAVELFSAVRDILGGRGARIIEERVFTTGVASEPLLAARSGAYGDLDDGVAPTILAGKDGAGGPISGVQVHAVSGRVETEVIRLGANPVGRVVTSDGYRGITISGVSSSNGANAAAQAEDCLEQIESVLRSCGTDFLSVARTWMWLGDILSWYDEFNAVRNSYFTKHGLIGDGSRQSMPASTGIGLGPVEGGACSMDLTAVVEPADSTEYLQAVGRQQCALEYGSAFSRAARAAGPGGKTVFVSGTASIDASGVTTNIGDSAGQIRETIENVRAVLGDTGCGDGDVVSAIVYSKSPEIQGVFEEIRGDLSWPWVEMICDICRPELLFEIEATALPGAERMEG